MYVINMSNYNRWFNILAFRGGGGGGESINESINESVNMLLYWIHMIWINAPQHAWQFFFFFLNVFFKNNVLYYANMSPSKCIIGPSCPSHPHMVTDPARHLQCWPGTCVCVHACACVKYIICRLFWCLEITCKCLYSKCYVLKWILNMGALKCVQIEWIYLFKLL